MMALSQIPEEISQRATAFASAWNTHLERWPEYTLDGSWHSTSVLDLILYPQRGKENSDQQLLQETLSGACAYLSCILASCWSALDNEIQVSLNWRDPEIEVVAKGGSSLQGEAQFLVKLFTLLKIVLTNPPLPLPVFANFSIPLARRSNAICPLAAGLLSGFTPHGQGPWKRRRPEDLPEHRDLAHSIYAHSLANKYSQLHPLETWGGKAELYGQPLLFPPIDCDQPFPALRAVSFVCNFFAQNNVSPEAQEQLMLNWSKSLDDNLAKLGFIFLIARCSALSHKHLQPAIDGSLNSTLLMLAENLGIRAAALRPAVLFCRTLLQIDGNWVQLLDQEELLLAQTTAYQDYHYRLLPHLSLPIIGYFSEEIFRPYLHAIAWNQTEKATNYYQQLSTLTSLPPAVKLQQVKLFSSLSQFPQAKALLEQASLEIHPEDLESQFLNHWLRAQILVKQADINEAQRSLHQALELPSRDYLGLTEAATELAALYLMQDQPQNASSLWEAALQRNPLALNIRLQRANYFLATNDYDQAQEEITALQKSCPQHHEVFQLVCALAAIK